MKRWAGLILVLVAAAIAAIAVAPRVPRSNRVSQRDRLKVFEQIVVVGMKKREVLRLMGDPDERSALDKGPLPPPEERNVYCWRDGHKVLEVHFSEDERVSEKRVSLEAADEP